MRTTSRHGRFKRDYKRVMAGPHAAKLDASLNEVIALLIADQSLLDRSRDHALTGEYLDCRECHVRPDLLLIYRKVGNDTLELVRLGSHAELFG
jgi:mRNA interferase YafQ